MAITILDDVSFYLLTSYYALKAFFGYRVQASFYLVQNFLSLLFNLISVSVIYSVSNGIAGWSFYQLLFLTNLSSLAFGIVLLLSNPGALPRILRQGQLDNFMPRPYGLLTLVMANSGLQSQLATVLGSILILAVSAAHLSFSFLDLSGFLLLFFAGIAAFIMFLEMLSLLSYSLFKSGSYIKQTINSLSNFGRYPLSIYGTATTLALTLLFPIGLASYYPAQAFFGAISIVPYISFLLIAVAFTFVFHRAFTHFMRFYESGGG